MTRINYKIILFGFLAAISLTNVLAQTLTIEKHSNTAITQSSINCDAMKPAWQRDHAPFQDGQGNNSAVDMVVDADGFVYITGTIANSITGQDYFTVKYDQSGRQIWSTTYNEPGSYHDDRAVDMAIDDDANIYITGTSHVVNSGSDYTTLKYNRDGILQWADRDDRGNGDHAKAIALGPDGSVYIAGQSGPYASVAKYNRKGVKLWPIHRLGSDDGCTNGYFSYSCEQETMINNGLIVDRWSNPVIIFDWISSWGTSTSDTDILGTAIQKLSGTGSRLWGKYPQSSSSFTNIVQDSLDNLYVLDQSAKLFKYGFRGNLLQEIQIDGLLGYYSTTMKDYGNFIYIGGSARADDSTVNSFIVKLDSAGTDAWRTNYDNATGTNVKIRSLYVDRDENVYWIGSESSKPLFLKYNKNGIFKWSIVEEPFDNGRFIPNAVTVDSAGNVTIAGQVIHNAYSRSFAVVQYDRNGKPKWQEQITGRGKASTKLTEAAFDGFGHVYMVGQSSGSNTKPNFAAIKYDEDGNELWSKAYNFSASSKDVPQAMAVDKQGHLFIAGSSSGAGTKDDVATVKFLNDGSLAWHRRYNGSGDSTDTANDIAIDSHGNIIVAGTSISAKNKSEITILKYSNDGDVLWEKSYSDNDPANHQAVALALDHDDNIYITGTKSSDQTIDEIVVLKYDKTGSLQWRDYYHGSDVLNYISADIQIDDAYNIYVLGTNYGQYNSTCLVTMKYHANGQRQWVAAYERKAGYSKGNMARIHIDKSGHVYVATPYADENRNNNILTIKYSHTGEMVWTARYHYSGPSGARAFPADIHVQPSGEVITLVKGSPANNRASFILVRHSNDGKVLDISQYGAGSHWNIPETPEHLLIDDAERFYVAGTAKSFGSQWMRLVQLKQAHHKTFKSSKLRRAFSPLTVGRSRTKKLKIINCGNSPLDIRSVTSDHAEFDITPEQATIGANRDTTFRVVFTPTTTGKKNGHLIFEHNGSSSPDTIKLSGKGLPNQFILQPSEILFEKDRVSDTTVVGHFYVISPENETHRVYYAGAWHYGFLVSPESATVFPGDTLVFEVKQKPSVAINDVVHIVVRHTGATSPDTVTLRPEGALAVSTRENDIPLSYSLSQNYPNPFNPVTTIQYAVSKPGHVGLKIFNAMGQEVAVLVNEKKIPGRYDVQWHAEDLPSGVYVYRLQAGKYIEKKKLVLLK